MHVCRRMTNTSRWIESGILQNAADLARRVPATMERNLRSIKPEVAALQLNCGTNKFTRLLFILVSRVYLCTGRNGWHNFVHTPPLKFLLSRNEKLNKYIFVARCNGFAELQYSAVDSFVS